MHFLQIVCEELNLNGLLSYPMTGFSISSGQSCNY